MWPLGGARVLSPEEEGRRTAGLVRGTSFLLFSREGPLSSHTGLTRPGPAQAPDGWGSSFTRAFPSLVPLSALQWKDPPRGLGWPELFPSSSELPNDTVVRGLG